MRAPDLFLAVLQELRQRVAAGDDYSMLRAAALLRQLLLDASPLMHEVNRPYKLKLLFVVCGGHYRRYILSMQPAPDLYCSFGGLHVSGLFSHQIEHVPLKEFLITPVLKSGPHIFTVADLITICANILGGVHKDAPQSEKEKALQAFEIKADPKHRSVHAAQMRPIILVVLDALEELRIRVEADAQQQVPADGPRPAGSARG